MKHVEWKCELGSDKCEQCNHDTHLELFICKVCNGAEVTLPKECPGVKMTPEQEEGISNGRLNYMNGEWYRVYVTQGEYDATKTNQEIPKAFGYL